MNYYHCNLRKSLT